MKFNLTLLKSQNKPQINIIYQDFKIQYVLEIGFQNP